MANDVFANGREISCKKADGKSICAFPDVCFTPPQTPATPPGVPIPYPNTGMAKDTTKGSKKVKISGKEIILKNKSHYKKSYGDEAGCAPKKGIINSKNRGKVYFTTWSMDVKIEGKNAVRHLDLATHNHASMIGNESIPWLYADSMAMVKNLSDDCKNEKKDFKDKCGKHITKHTGGPNKGGYNASGSNAAMCEDDECKKARECVLLPKAFGCCEHPDEPDLKNTGHHLLPNSLFQESGERGGGDAANVPGLKKGKAAYTEQGAPCVCVENDDQSQNGDTEHGELHRETKNAFLEIMVDQDEDLTYEKAKKAAAQAHTETITDDSGKPRCKAECLEAQLDLYFTSVSSGKKKDPNKIQVRQVGGMTSKVYR
jgi:hypothetical protein